MKRKGVKNAFYQFINRNGEKKHYTKTNRTKAPAILIELAFLSNPTEEKLLIEKPEIFANAIWEAIKKFKEKNLISL